MNLVFMNSLEKKTGEDRVTTAKVSICEHNGTWQVFWAEPNDSGEQEQTMWFEGTAWNEMLKVFRVNVLQKMAEGYAPLLDNVTGDIQSINGKAELIQKLYYYSELHKNEPVFEELRAWRRSQAGKEGKAPYIIATNRLLQVIASFLPQTPEELLQIPGFGQYKLNLYGSGILAITTKMSRDWSFPLNWVADKIDYVQYKLWVHHQQQAYEQREAERKNRKLAVLEAALRGDDLAALEAASVPRREAVALLEELDQDGYDVDKIIDAELGRIADNEREKAVSAFKELGDRYLKPVLKAVYGEDTLKEQDADRAYEWLRLLRIRLRKEKGTSAAA